MGDYRAHVLVLTALRRHALDAAKQCQDPDLRRRYHARADELNAAINSLFHEQPASEEADPFADLYSAARAFLEQQERDGQESPESTTNQPG